jgi:hypothetical protein
MTVEMGATTTVWDAVAECQEGRGGEHLNDVQIGGPWTPDQPFALPSWVPHAHDGMREAKLRELSLRWTGLIDKDA